MHDAAALEPARAGVFALFTARGEITGIYHGREDELDGVHQGRQWLGPVADPSTLDPLLYYVDAGRIVPRPDSPVVADRLEITADGHDAVTLSSLPSGAEVTIRGQTYCVDDGCFAWDTDLPGSYRMQVQCWPFRDVEFRARAST